MQNMPPLGATGGAYLSAAICQAQCRPPRRPDEKHALHHRNATVAVHQRPVWLNNLAGVKDGDLESRAGSLGALLLSHSRPAIHDPRPSIHEPVGGSTAVSPDADDAADL